MHRTESDYIKGVTPSPLEVGSKNVVGNACTHLNSLTEAWGSGCRTGRFLEFKNACLVRLFARMF